MCFCMQGRSSESLTWTQAGPDPLKGARSQAMPFLPRLLNSPSATRSFLRREKAKARDIAAAFQTLRAVAGWPTGVI